MRLKKNSPHLSVANVHCVIQRDTWANLGIASALFRRGDTIIEDRLNHASLLDAGLQQGVEFSRYQHNNLDLLQSYLSISKVSRKWVLSDGVFSMDGDIARLKELASLCHQHQAWLMIDDAHGFGVLGEQGQGSVAAAGLSVDDVPCLYGNAGQGGWRVWRFHCRIKRVD